MSEYEELRHMGLGASGARPGAGFALFIRRGMAAWMDTASASVARPLPTTRDDRVVPSSLRGEVAMVLASMALACRIEGGLTT